MGQMEKLRLRSFIVAGMIKTHWNRVEIEYLKIFRKINVAECFIFLSNIFVRTVLPHSNRRETRSISEYFRNTNSDILYCVVQVRQNALQSDQWMGIQQW